MTHFFEKRDRWGHGMSLWVLVVIAFLTPVALWSNGHLRLENDIENWLPPDDPEAKALIWYHEHFHHDIGMLATWEGSSLNDPRIPAFARELEGTVDEHGVRHGGSEYIKRVVTPADLVARMKVEQDEAIERINGVLVGTGDLKVRLTEAGRSSQAKVEERLKSEALAQLGLEIEIRPPLIEYFEDSDLELADGEEIAVEETEEVTFPPVPDHDLQIHWAGISPKSDEAAKLIELAGSLTAPAIGGGEDSLVDESFFATGSPVALMISLSEAGIADAREAVETVRQAAFKIGIPEEQLHLGGQPVAGSALNQAVAKAGWNTDYPIWQIHRRSPLLMSCVVGVILAFIVLRSIRLAILVQIVANCAVMFTVALIYPTGGSMNMVLVVMPTLLLVLTISGAIHVANYWKHAAHEDMSTAVVEAAKMAKLPCLLASLTTAIGLFSLTTSPLTPVRDFGVYSGIGCIISLVLVLFALPALLQYWPAKPPKAEEVNRANWKQLGRFLSRYPAIVIVLSMGVFVGSAYGLKWFRTETKVIRYFPEHTRVVQDYYYLEENLAGIIPVELVVRFDENAQNDLNFLQRMEIVREIGDGVRAHPEISGVLSLPDFRPVSDTLSDDASSLAKMRYNRTANTTEQGVREDEQAKSFYTVAEEAADLREEGDARLNAAGDELWRITAQVAIMSDLDYATLTNHEQTGALDEIAKSVLKYHPGTAHVVTGMVPLFLRTQDAVLDSLITSFALAFAVIAVVLIVVLRNPAAGIITMLPNLMPVALVFGLISWYGIRVDIGTMITASVALGIAVDGTLHLMTWFQHGIQQGQSRSEAVSQALGHCGPAMWQTSLAVGSGLVMLLPVELLLVSRFGWLMAAMIGAALIADIIVLPALLAGPLGYLLERRVRATQDSDPTPPDAQKESPAMKPHLAQLPQRDDQALRID